MKRQLHRLLRIRGILEDMSRRLDFGGTGLTVETGAEKQRRMALGGTRAGEFMKRQLHGLLRVRGILEDMSRRLDFGGTGLTVETGAEKQRAMALGARGLASS